MTNIVIIGMTGEGKSEIPKEMIRGKSAFVFDQNNEYGKVTKYPGQIPLNMSDNWEDNYSRHIDGDFEKFIDQVLTKKSTIVVFEEATGFLSGKVGKKFKRIMVNKLFTKNVYIYLFHSIVDVPQEVMRLCNICVLFRTNDEVHFIQAKYPRLLPYFTKLKTMPKGSSYKIKMV